MPNLFVDIETAPNMTKEEYIQGKKRIDAGTLTRDSKDSDMYWKIDKGAVSPLDGKVILIVYRVGYDGPIVRLKEWEDGEEEILRKFYHKVVELGKDKEDRIKFIGQNILRFDIPFLFRRMQEYRINAEDWLRRNMLGPMVIDFLQIHIGLNGLSGKNLKHDVFAHAYGLPEKYTGGGDETLHYFNGEYDKILEYSEREFIYPEMYRKIVTNGMVTKEQLQESIKYYNETHPEAVK